MCDGDGFDRRPMVGGRARITLEFGILSKTLHKYAPQRIFQHVEGHRESDEKAATIMTQRPSAN